MPLTGGKPRLAGYSQSPHMVGGGTQSTAYALLLARIPLCKGAQFACLSAAHCFQVLSQEQTTANDTNSHFPPARSSIVVPDPSQQRILFCFVLVFLSVFFLTFVFI